MKIVVVGGVAAGASAAARLRRLDEFAEIKVFERSPDVSFANCGLPYHVGGEIQDRSLLALQTPESLKAMLNLDVQAQHEVTKIIRENKTVVVKNLLTGEESEEHYDKLILAPGASPLMPPIPGIEDERVKTLRNLQDMDAIIAKIPDVKKVVVIGAGFIGLEMAEQLSHLGKDVSLVELQDQVLPPLDPEMAQPIQTALTSAGINVVLGDGISGFEDKGETLNCLLNSGGVLQSEMVVLSIGVRPESELAKDAGLELGPRGHIVVNEFQQTNDPDVYAAGDVVETEDGVIGGKTVVPLGGPANRQGRLIADHIAQPDKALPYPGSLGTAIVRAFKMAAGITGLSEKRLAQTDIEYGSIVVTDLHHAGYYPGATPLSLKVVYETESRRILGAQAFGENGVDKRLDVIATAIRGKLTLDDLENLELAYAPPFGSAKDPVNIASFAARNELNELVELVTELPSDPETQIIDVRPDPMRALSPVPGSIGIPLPQLRSRLDEIDKSRPVVTVCKVGKSSYFASRILKQRGYQVKSYSGGLLVR